MPRKRVMLQPRPMRQEYEATTSPLMQFRCSVYNVQTAVASVYSPASRPYRKVTPESVLHGYWADPDLNT